MNIKKSRFLIVILLLFLIKGTYANISKEITLLPTIKTFSLLEVNIEKTAQYVVQNLSEETVILAMMPQKGVTQDTTSLLACSHPFTLVPGQKCFLNLKIKGNKIGQKIINGPLICKATPEGAVTQDTPFCIQPTIRDKLSITIVSPRKAIIEVKPQALNIHAASLTPMKLTVTNHSETITAHNIRADLPNSWNDVSQNAKDCMEVKPNKNCTIYFNAKHAHPLEMVPVSGSNTIKIHIRVKIEAHDSKKHGLPI